MDAISVDGVPLDSDGLADDCLDDPVLLFVSEVIKERQAHELVADALGDRAVARFSAKAYAHIRKVQR